MKKNKTKDFSDGLKAFAENLKRIHEQNLEDIKKQVDDIISVKLEDEKIIEHTFDQLLDLAYYYGTDIQKVYYKLLDYYEKINLEASEDYKKLYLEILNEMGETEVYLK